MDFDYDELLEKVEELKSYATLENDEQGEAVEILGNAVIEEKSIVRTLKVKRLRWKGEEL